MVSVSFAAGHLNGLLKNLLHADSSERNIWWSIGNLLGDTDMISEWSLDSAQYPKCFTVLDNWSLAEGQNTAGQIQGGITVSPLLNLVVVVHS